MVNVIILSHGGLANGLYDAANMIIGNMENVHAFGLLPKESPDEFRERVYSVIDARPKEQFLILVDIICGTPFNSMIAKFKQDNVYVVTGVNLPMLLETMMHREDTLAALGEHAEAMGHQGIANKQRFLEISEEEDEDEY